MSESTVTPTRAQTADCTFEQSVAAVAVKWMVLSLQSVLKTFWAPVARLIVVT